MYKTGRICVLHGILGITLFYFSIMQGLALSGINFGDMPIIRGWFGGIVTTFSGGGASLLLRSALFRKNGNGHAN